MPVALVESEKTAVVSAGLMPKYLWLATSGKSQLNPDRLSVLAIVKDLIKSFIKPIKARSVF